MMKCESPTPARHKLPANQLFKKRFLVGDEVTLTELTMYDLRSLSQFRCRA
jgi:hypothetical protein